MPQLKYPLFDFGNVSDASIRKWLDEEAIKKIVDSTLKGYCQCCNEEDLEGADECQEGHKRCERCKSLDHRCLACIIAT